MRILRSLPLCKGLPHLRGTGRSTARAVLWGSRHVGSKGNPQKSSMRRMTPSGSAPSASYCAPPSSRRAPAETRRPACAAASNWRASTRCAPSSASVWREVQRRLGFLLLLRAGGPKGDGAGCHIVCPIPIGTSLPRWEDLLRPHQLHQLCRCHKSTSRLT